MYIQTLLTCVSTEQPSNNGVRGSTVQPSIDGVTGATVQPINSLV